MLSQLLAVPTLAATGQALPYANAFSEVGYIPAASDGWTVKSPSGTVSVDADGWLAVSADAEKSNERFVKLDFAPENTGTVVFETDFKVSPIGYNGSNGMVNAYASDGKQLLRLVVDGRGAGSTFINQKINNETNVQNINWGHTVQLFRIRVEIDFDSRVWRIWQNTYDGDGKLKEYQLTYTNGKGGDFPFLNTAANNVSAIELCLYSSDDKLDNWTVYKKVSACQGETDISMYIGDTHTAQLTYTPTDEVMADMAWESSDRAVASVDSDGKITAHKAGSAAVTAKSAFYGVSFEYRVEVLGRRAQSVKLREVSKKLFVGETLALIYETVPQSAYVGTQVWESSDESVARVDSSGVVTAVGCGSAKITLTAQNGGKTCCTVRVVNINDDKSVINMSNTDFEKDTPQLILRPLSGWIAIGQDGAKAPQWSAGGVGGSAGCAKLTEISYLQKQDLAGLRAGDRYTLSFWLKIVSLDEGASARVQVGPRGRAYIFSDSYYSTDGEWQKKTIDFIVPEDAGEPFGEDNAGRIEILLRLVGGCGEIYYDNIRITNSRDETRLDLYSDGLKLDSYVDGAPLMNTRLHYVSGDRDAALAIVAVYEEDRLVDVKLCDVTNDTLTMNISDMVNVDVLTEKSEISVFIWDGVSQMKPLDTKKTSLDGEKMNSVYGFFARERMRGAYGAAEEIYKEDTKRLITEGGINTLILNLSPIDGVRIVTDFDKLDAFLDDAEKLSEETGVRIFAKMAYGSSQGNVDAPVGNTACGKFEPGFEHSYRLPCPRSEEYWNKQITEVLSRCAAHRGICGVVIDMEMYSGGISYYPSPCLCDSCVADFDEANGMQLLQIALDERNSYIKKNGIYEKYLAWHSREITRITANVRRAIHTVNPNVIIGCMPECDWIAGSAKGLGTPSMPLMVFNENEYKGTLDYIYGNTAKIELDDIDAVYVPGLWTTSDYNTADEEKTPAVAAEAFAAKAAECAENSMGYWIYSLQALREDENSAAYTDAIKSANTAIDKKYMK